MNNGSKVAAVVVIYNPDESALAQLLGKLSEQCNIAVLVDNSASPRTDRVLPEDLEIVCIRNRENLGIGAAQNIGIKVALDRGADYVAVFDQDSVPSESMIERLVAADQELRGKGVKVAAVGPQLVDETTGEFGAFIAFEGLRKRRLRPRSDSAPVGCFSLLASGTLFRRDVLSHVGLMNEELFLEYVDVEWGARALSKGYTCYGVPSATLFHNLGDSRVRLPGGLTVPFHRPLRHYYTMRNAMFMQRQSYVPFFWKINDVGRTLAGFVIYGSFNPPRIKQILMMSLGILHGIKKISGPYSADASSFPSAIKKVLKWASS